MAKIETLLERDLIQMYLKANYPDKTVLVIHGGGWGSSQEEETLYEELERNYLRPSCPMSTYGYCIIEPQDFQIPAIMKIADDFSHGSLIVELYQNGVCVEEED